jgi:hypothetical protein
MWSIQLMSKTYYQQAIPRFFLTCSLIAGLLLSIAASAQQGTFFNERDNQ